MLRKIFNKNLNKSHFRNIHIIRQTQNLDKVMTTPCQTFLDLIDSKVNQQHIDCLNERKKVFQHSDYNYRNDTKEIRKSDWTAKSTPESLLKRHVELTGPGNDSKMVINAINSSANAYMLDLEDSMTPSWDNVIDAHSNIIQAVRGTLSDTKMDSKGNIIKEYNINNDNKPSFFVRARGLHMLENNVTNNDHKPLSATVFDIGTFMFHNAKYLHNNKMGPNLYIPKLESYEDAKFISRVINECEELLDIPHGTTNVTVLIETFPAIFQTNEIIYALKDHIVGLNCGRWDYLFSMIKCLGSKTILPDRNLLSMNQPFLEAYVNEIVTSCHRRNIHAMGGMSAFIPTTDKDENIRILNDITMDKILEIERGCDGAWVAHPGLIQPIQDLFEDKLGGDNMINYIPDVITMKVDKDKDDLIKLDGEVSYSESTLRDNISISLQYISAWLSGNGAVALNNLMEDLATSEISVFQIKQWLNNNVTIDGDYGLNEEILTKIIDEEYEKMLKSNMVNYASRNFVFAKDILTKYVMDREDKYHFLPDVAQPYLNNKNGYNSVQFDKKTISGLAGSRTLRGVELTKHRGEFLNRFLYEEGNDSYKFLGTSNGIAGVNVVAGGKGKVGPYAGGWQSNAMKNRLGMLLPDTLHVSPEEVANCAEEINHHLERADQVQHIQKLNDPDFPDCVDYYDMALLADLEQGWSVPEKTRISVKKAILNGINVIHIEDQGVAKRCGHLGDKELNTYEDHAVLMRSANLAAQELLGPEQADKQWVRFVARTDAYSAKRIHNSRNLHDNNNPEYKFVDWDRGYSPDGKYLYLNQGVNPDTGRTWGLDLSIERSARLIDDGLASHVWMETPTADLQIAKDFITNVNNILLPKGKRGYGLYNHSPSFDWDVKFFAEAEILTDMIINYVIDEVYGYAHSLCDDVTVMNRLLTSSYSSVFEDSIRNFISNHGEEVQGDKLFTDENIKNISMHCLDYVKGEEKWLKNINSRMELLGSSNIDNSMKAFLNQQKINGFNPKKNITEIIVDQRLNNFSPMLASFGFDMHLITLPEFHVTAYNMHMLADDFAVNGINAFVKNTQRPERIYSETDKSYTYYKHQTATGTGIEALFNQSVGSSNVNTLSDSTESDDTCSREN